MSEQITEKGIVSGKKNGILEVILAESGRCGDCSAKLFCKPKGENQKTVLVRDTIGCRVGDCIDFSVPGKNLLKISFVFYGVPLILLVSVILFFNCFFSGNQSGELYSILISITAVAVYFLLLFFTFRRKGSPLQNMPVTVYRY